MQRKVGWSVGVVLLLGIAVAGAGAYGGRTQFATTEGIGPDKWSSIWLIRRYIDVNATIEFVADNAPLEGKVAFDIDRPDVVFRRTGDATTYERLVKEYGIGDPSVRKLGVIINEIERNRWSLEVNSVAAQIEEAFRTLQRRYGRVGVPFACYMQFFDEIHGVLVELSNIRNDIGNAGRGRDCEVGSETALAKRSLVAELPAKTILARIGAGEKVVFVDAREPDEFAEFHIPNAVSLQLRDVDTAAAEKLADADLVVPYCVKDFRGYEVARAFQKVGLHKVAIMNPYGIKGWRQAGLPVAGKLALTEDEAARQLASCARDSATCLKKL